MMQAAGGHTQTVLLLFHYGASVESLDRDGRTPLAIACKYGRAHRAPNTIHSTAQSTAQH